MIHNPLPIIHWYENVEVYNTCFRNIVETPVLLDHKKKLPPILSQLKETLQNDTRLPKFNRPQSIPLFRDDHIVSWVIGGKHGGK
jgi:hypothetical protein